MPGRWAAPIKPEKCGFGGKSDGWVVLLQTASKVKRYWAGSTGAGVGAAVGVDVGIFVGTGVSDGDAVPVGSSVGSTMEVVARIAVGDGGLGQTQAFKSIVIRMPIQMFFISSSPCTSTHVHPNDLSLRSSAIPDGSTMTEPSGKTTVGTLWYPPVTLST